MKKKPNPPPNSLTLSQVVTRAIIAAGILLFFSIFAFVITNVYFHSQSDRRSPLPEAPLQKLPDSPNQQESTEKPASDVTLTFYERLSGKKGAVAEIPASPAGDSEAKSLPAPIPETKVPNAPVDTDSPGKLTEDQIGPVSYSVQVGSFRNLQTAQGVLDKLRREGFSPFITPVHFPEGAVWYRVRIGSSLARNDAEKIAQKIQKKGVFQPLVVPIQ